MLWMNVKMNEMCKVTNIAETSKYEFLMHFPTFVNMSYQAVIYLIYILDLPGFNFCHEIGYPSRRMS
jgi:hypothetical protein